jgi:thiol-disulfide isomerase/thioredoxin
MDQHEETVELYQHHNKVIVVDFSAMWCGVCRNIAAKGDEFIATYGEENFIWLTVLIDDSSGNPPDLADLQTWATTYGIEAPVLAGNRDMIDVSGETGYPITSWPTLVVIDRSMVLQYGINGWNETTISGWVESLL